MKKPISVSILIILLGIIIGLVFFVAQVSIHSDYRIVATNWIRADKTSFTIQIVDVTCETFTIDVLAFFSETMAEELMESPEYYSQLYTELKLVIDPAVNLEKINESRGPFGYYALHQTETFLTSPRLVKGESYHVLARIKFNEFAGVREAIPFEVDITPENCQ